MLRLFTEFSKRRQSCCQNLNFTLRHLSSTHCFLNASQDENVLEKNPYFEKYSDKIKLAQESGIYVKKQQASKKCVLEQEEWKAKMKKAERQLAKQASENKGDKTGSKLPLLLNKLMRLDLLADKSSEEIAHLWSEYFKTQESVSAVISGATFERMHKRSIECPMFLYPLPKSEGYEFVLSQFDRTRCFFTSLINFQAHGDSAPWQLCLVFYTELKESHGIVLMAGEIDTNVLGAMEAQCLAQLQQMFYASTENDLFELVQRFNHSPADFKYMDLIKEIENSNMIVKHST